MPLKIQFNSINVFCQKNQFNSIQFIRYSIQFNSSSPYSIGNNIHVHIHMPPFFNVTLAYRQETLGMDFRAKST